MQCSPREGNSSSSKTCTFLELHKMKPFSGGRLEVRWAVGRWEEMDGWMEGLEE